MIVQTA